MKFWIKRCKSYLKGYHRFGFDFGYLGKFACGFEIYFDDLGDNPERWSGK